jgi:hypothetical protein
MAFLIFHMWGGGTLAWVEQKPAVSTMPCSSGRLVSKRNVAILSIKFGVICNIALGNWNWRLDR